MVTHPFFDVCVMSINYIHKQQILHWDVKVHTAVAALVRCACSNWSQTSTSWLSVQQAVNWLSTHHTNQLSVAQCFLICEYLKLDGLYFVSILQISLMYAGIFQTVCGVGISWFTSMTNVLMHNKLHLVIQFMMYWWCYYGSVFKN